MGEANLPFASVLPASLSWLYTGNVSICHLIASHHLHTKMNLLSFVCVQNTPSTLRHMFSIDD